jgi:hypothetical protein
MSKEPISHHYLPQFYLKAFNFEYSKKKKIYRVFSYDKEFQRVVTPKSTKEICCEKHRNTLQVDNVKDFFIEKSLSELETQIANLFRMIGHSQKDLLAWDAIKFTRKKSLISLEPIMEIPYASRLFNYFISVFYWRLTIHDEYFELNTTKTFLSKSIGKLLDKSNNFVQDELNIVPDFLCDIKSEISLPFILGEEDSFMKVYKNLIYPLYGIYIDKSAKYKLYRLYVPDQSIVSSDVPFITMNQQIGLDQTFIFTWSPNLVYINVSTQNNIKINDINKWLFKLSVLNYLQAKRYVFCNERTTLENVIYYSNMRSGSQCIEQVKSELWALINL